MAVCDTAESDNSIDSAYPAYGRIPGCIKQLLLLLQHPLLRFGLGLGNMALYEKEQGKPHGWETADIDVITRTGPSVSDTRRG